MATRTPALGAPRSSGSIAVVSTYPPTRCGLATFSSALIDALRTRRPGQQVGVVALGEHPPRHDDIVFTLNGGGRAQLDAAAAVLNRFDTVILQHEYGIYRGPDGASAVELLHRLTRPTITVLHTVLQHPSDSQRRVLEQVVDASSATVVMTEVARTRLVERYAVERAAVHVIPHGSSAGSGQAAHDHDDRPLLLSWGLLGPGKGVEMAIDALSHLRDLDPAPRYVVAGQTHPKVRERLGESYRDMLMDRARDRGVGHLVTFDDRYLDREALTGLIHRADVVLLPYESREQVTSGVLVDAIACGRPVLATAFPHAVEISERGAGITVPQGDTAGFARALRAMLVDPGLAADLQQGARRMAGELAWDAVAARYLRLAEQLQRQRRAPWAAAHRGRRSASTGEATLVP